MSAEPTQPQATARPATGRLLCEGCNADTAVPHAPSADLVDVVRVFLSAHAHCESAWFGYRIDLNGGAT